MRTIIHILHYWLSYTRKYTYVANIAMVWITVVSLGVNGNIHFAKLCNCDLMDCCMGGKISTTGWQLSYGDHYSQWMNQNVLYIEIQAHSISTIWSRVTWQVTWPHLQTYMSCAFLSFIFFINLITSEVTWAQVTWHIMEGTQLIQCRWVVYFSVHQRQYHCDVINSTMDIWLTL